MLRVYLNFIFINNKIKKFYTFFIKCIFKKFNIKLGLLKIFINKFKILLIFFFGLQKNKNVVEVNYIKIIN